MARRGKKQPIQINSVADKIKAEGQCRQCNCVEKSSGSLKGRGVRELSRHRLVPGREGGEYIVANVIPLCRACHDDVERQSPEARRRLRPKLWPLEVSHVLKRMGAEWFELMYPKPAAASVMMREVDAMFCDVPEPESPPALQGFGAKGIRRKAKSRRMWDPDTAVGPSEKSLARRRDMNIATISEIA